MLKVRVTEEGRLSLPAEVRKRHGLSRGGDLVVEDRGDSIVLRTVAQVVAEAKARSRALLAGSTGTSVDDFLAERHEAAIRE